MSNQPVRPPNQLRPRPLFEAGTQEFIQRLDEEIADLKTMKQAGFAQTSDGQCIDRLIALRQQFIHKAMNYPTNGRSNTFL